jgi:hypothetical protein
MSSAQPLGYRFCLKQLGLTPWPLFCESRLGAKRSAGDEDGHRVQVYPESAVVSGEGESAIATHLEFALRHEGVDLAAMAAVCAAMDPAYLAAWISMRPSSKYARRIGFLYEWLTGRELPVDATLIAGSYEPVLDPKACFTGPSSNIPRWHVRNNLPGTPEWCPTVHRLGAQGTPVGVLDVPGRVAASRAGLPPAILARVRALAALAEVHASYSLAGQTASHAQEAAVVGLLRSAGDVPADERLTPARLIQLQGALFKGEASHAAYGLRREDGFVGSAGSMDFQRVEYPCPPARTLEPLLAGLSASAARLAAEGAPPAVRAAVVSFGFGLIHPLLEGNGRVQRFLIHATLAAAGAVRSGSVIPVSEVMLARREEHEQALRAWPGLVRASAEGLAQVPFLLPPGQKFSFPGYERVAPLYRYPVLTGQAAYLEEVLREAIDAGLAGAARGLQAQAAERGNLAARRGLAPARLDLILRLISQQGGTHAVRTRFPQLADEALREAEALALPRHRSCLADDPALAAGRQQSGRGC